ncbi:MAG: hypothetical protein KFF73_18440 [Cyclobacteriaceae bacterium]|nr:hypothetical protein [Cyclobacteriaceae bacterium]
MKRVLGVFVAMMSINLAMGQVIIEEGEKPSVFDRMYFGGGFGASFGDITSVYVSPVVGYMITRSLSAGVGITYQYYSDSRFDYQTNTYGGKLFARQNLSLLKLPLFLYAEYETLNFEVYEPRPPDDYVLTRDWIPSLFFGGGFFQPFGRRGGFSITAMYNVIYDEARSPYNSPWVFRVGFTL